MDTGKWRDDTMGWRVGKKMRERPVTWESRGAVSHYIASPTVPCPACTSNRSCYPCRMLTNYIRAAMAQAHYEILDDGAYYGEIPALRGVLAMVETLETCREELQEVLEGWIVLGLQLGHTLPPMGGVELRVEPEVA